MANYVDMNSITLADFLNGLATFINNAIDTAVNSKLQAIGGAGSGVEKPLSTQEACDFLDVCEPVLRQLAESGRIPRHKFKGQRGYYYFASELVAALKGQKSLV